MADNLVVGAAAPNHEELLRLLGVVAMPETMRLELVIVANDGEKDVAARATLQATRVVDTTAGVKCVVRLQTLLDAFASGQQ